MKLVLTVFALLFTGTMENAIYIQKMKETIKEMESCQTVEDYKRVANTFERIAKTETKEWLPIYYNANIHILLIYIDQSATTEQKDRYLDLAEEMIKRMEELSPHEPEVQTLKAFHIISRIGLDPAGRGAMYPSYQQTLAKAVQYGPENPRVKYMVLSSKVGEANFFGNSVEPFCADMRKLYDEWDSYPVVSEIHPKWGKDQVAELMKPCK